MAVDRNNRSRNMSRIRSKDTAIELQVRRALHAAGFRFRLHRADLPGRPDVVLPKYRTVVFVNGCYWHGHQCIKGHRPRTNTDYWGPKIAGNIFRDERNHAALRELGWLVETIRECEVTRNLADLMLELKASSAERRGAQ